MQAKHMLLTNAYFGCDVDSQNTRFGADPRVDNVLNNIIGVHFLSMNGCDVIHGEDDKETFYYRVKELQIIISDKIKGKRLLFKNLPAVDE